MISNACTPREIKNNFLSKNSKYSEIEDNNEALGDFFAINDDDEVWLMQCPKKAHITLLQDQKIKLPGRSNHNEFETLATEYAEPVPHAFGHKNKKGHNNIKIVPVRGSIIMRNRLKVLTPPDASVSEVSSVRVPLPIGIKQRHPLHGYDFTNKVKICPQIAERLKHIDEASTQELSKSKDKSKQKSNESNTIVMDSDGEVELVLQKKHKHKKKKRNHSSGDDGNDVPVKKKKKGKNKSQIEDVAEDLQWIQRL